MRAEVDTKALLTRARQMLSEVYYPGRDEPYETIASLIKAVEALPTLQMQSSDPEELERVEERVKSLLAAPMQSEPVAWRWRSKDPQHDHRWIYTESDDIATAAKDRPNLFEVQPLFAASQADLRERDELRNSLRQIIMVAYDTLKEKAPLWLEHAEKLIGGVQNDA